MSNPNSYSYEDILRCGQGELFGQDNTRLPLPDMLMLDRISHISADGGVADKGEIRAELDISPDLWFFSRHFPGDPVMPGCLGLDALWQLVGFFLGWKGNPGKGRDTHPVRSCDRTVPAADRKRPSRQRRKRPFSFPRKNSRCP